MGTGGCDLKERLFGGCNDDEGRGHPQQLNNTYLDRCLLGRWQLAGLAPFTYFSRGGSADVAVIGITWLVHMSISKGTSVFRDMSAENFITLLLSAATIKRLQPEHDKAKLPQTATPRLVVMSHSV